MTNNLPASINFSAPEVVKTLKDTVAKDTTNAELALFVEVCKSTGLNPFKREVWCIKTGRGLQIMTGINGFYRVANDYPEFDGIETDVIEENGKLIKAVARVYRKDRSRPMTFEAYWEEYNKGTGNWKVMPRVMLSKCAESMALRKAFPQQLNGLYTQEEMPPEYAQPAKAPQKVEVVAQKPGKPEKSAEQPSLLEPGKLYTYDISGVAPEKLEAALNYLTENEAHPDLDRPAVWLSMKPLPKLKKYLITEEAN